MPLPLNWGQWRWAGQAEVVITLLLPVSPLRGNLGCSQKGRRVSCDLEKGRLQDGKG